MGVSLARGLTSLIVSVAFYGVTAAEITLFQDFDSGALDVAASQVIGNEISLVGRRTWTDPLQQDNYRWVHFKASGVAGLQPEFRIDEPSFLGSLAGHRYVYSYDQQNWSYFDHGEIVGSDYLFGNSTSFSEDDVYISYALPYPVSQTRELVDAASFSPYVFPTASSDSQLILGQSSGGFDELGRGIAPHDLFGFKITDPVATGPKLKVVAAAGAHAGETGGSYALDGLVRYLLSDDPLAVNLRTKAELYVYPQVNPDGRFAGYYRSSVENPEKDFNRFYDNPDGFTDLTIITDAMRQDTGGDADYVIDFHSWFGPWINDNYVLTTAELANSPLLQNLAVWEPNLDVAISNGQPGMLRVWSMTAEGLNAEFTYTPELGFHPGVTTDRLRLYGENFARALADVAGAPADCDLNVDGFCDVIDADLLTELGDLVQGVESPHPRFDLDADGDADVDDLELWLAVAAIQNGFAQPYFLGDANLDSVVDGQDFIAWNANKFTAGTRWSLGDFDGDGVVDGSDFLDWNRNKFSMITAMVPEPSMCLVWLGVVTIGLWRRETLTRTTIHSLKSAQASGGGAGSAVTGQAPA